MPSIAWAVWAVLLKSFHSETHVSNMTQMFNDTKKACQYKCLVVLFIYGPSITILTFSEV